MAANKVFVPTTGAAYLVKPGSGLQVAQITSAVSPISEYVEMLGLLGQDGVTLTPERSMENIRVMNYGATVKRVVTEASITLAIALAEFTDTADKLYFGSERDEEGRIEWKVGMPLPAALVLDIVTQQWGGVAGNGVLVDRYLIPNGTVDDPGEMSYVFGEATVRNMTFRGDVDPQTGVAAYQWRTLVSADTSESAPTVPPVDPEG